MKPKPYVGITGPVTEQEVNYIVTQFASCGYSMSSNHLPMLGFLVSQKTLNEEHVNNRRYPEFKYLRKLIERTENEVLPMIHYNSREMSTLSEQLKRVFDGIYDICKAVQLNIIFPDIKQIAKIKKELPDLQIVFQASKSVIGSKSSKELSEKVFEYGDLIDYVLIDPSGGKGIEINLEHYIDFYNEISSNANLTVGFAGGFTGENVVSRVNGLIDRIGHNNFCIDVEGGLRDKITPDYGDDILNEDKVRSYLQESSKVFKVNV